MSWRNPRVVEKKIRRLTREIEEIDRFFYRGNEKEDRALYAGMLERKRDDMIRSAVLQMHTAIENLLNRQIICWVLKVSGDSTRKIRTKSGHSLYKMLFGAGSIGFDMKLNFATALGLINTKTKERLMILNTLRNKCSHNWLLKIPVRRGKRPGQKKPPLLLYQGRDLHHVSALKQFAGEYGIIYFRLFIKSRD